MSDNERFQTEVREDIIRMSADKPLVESSWHWMLHAAKHRYSHHFTWLGRPIIQFPQDIVGLQEIFWECKPDLVIETGIAHGGSLMLSASLLALLDYCEAAESGTELTPRASRRRVLGIDIDIRPHNRAALEAHPLGHMVEMIQGSSIDDKVIAQVHERAKTFNRVVVCLDSNHTHEHVLAELMAYAPLTSRDCYCIVFDTAIEDAPAALFTDRPWGKGNSPKSAVREFLNNHPEFAIDKLIVQKLLISVAPDGYLRRVA